MINNLQLPTCPPLGPIKDDKQPIMVPAGWNGDPFTLLPKPYVLNDEEAELARRYRDNDSSKGYLRSQIAAFRAPQPREHHERRRSALVEIETQLLETSLHLPAAFVSVFNDDAICNRLRHSNIWLNLAPLVFNVPELPNCRAVQFTAEGQGCFYFSLLLDDHGDHCVLYHEDEAIWCYPPPARSSPRLSSIVFRKCCATFDVWLAHYFAACREQDSRYTEILKQYPGF